MDIVKKESEAIENDDKKTCFIITPIGEDNSDIRRHINGIIDAAIIPSIDDEYIVIVPHRMHETTAITKQIYQSIFKCDLVIANLTGLNPNVMYELAIRFCIGKPVIIIAEEGTVLPFDVKDHRTIFYTNDAMGILELQNKLKSCLNTIKDFHIPSSPIHDSLGEMALFEQVEQNDNKDTAEKMLSYIMKRLDKIESSFDNYEINSINGNSKHYQYILFEINKMFNDIENNQATTTGIQNQSEQLQKYIERNKDYLTNYEISQLGNVLSNFLEKYKREHGINENFSKMSKSNDNSET